MNNFVTNMMYVVFPLLVYFVLIAYNKSINKNDNKCFLEISLIISLYMAMSLGKPIYIYDNFYLFNIPLLIGYLKRRNSISLIMSIIIVLYALLYTDLNIILVIINYVLLFILYKLDKKYFIYNYIIINSIFLFIYHFEIDYIIILVIYVITTLLVISLYNKIDKTMKFYMTIKDIENNKQLQESLFKISHEIKNPIAVCKGYLELMDGSINTYQKYVPIINKEINHSLSILKDFSSIGKLKIEADVMDIGLLLEEVINDFDIILKEHNIMIDYNNIFDELYIMGDYVRLKEVLINIIKNAIEALESINKPLIKIIVEQKNNKVILKIIDNGCGMGEEELARITEPFYTTKKDGTGLGTYLSREIIEGHKGSISYYSRKNNGMEVIIKLNSMAI